MALIPNEPGKQYRLLGILVAVGATVLYWMYVYVPRQQELGLVENRLAEIEYYVRTAEAKTGGLELYRREVAARERELAALRRLIPERGEVADLYRSIAVHSRSEGLELVRVSPMPPRLDSATHFLRQEWRMAVEGGYHQVARFMTEVASLDRMVRPGVMEIVPADGQETTPRELTVELQLETFVLPGEGEASGSAPGGAAP